MALNLFRVSKGVNLDNSVHIIHGAAAPSTASDVVAAPVGSLYVDTTNKDLYIKISIAGSDSSDWELKIARADLDTLFGVSGSNLGNFTGTTIADSSSVKSALQALETQVETNVTNISNVQSEVDGIEAAMGSVVDSNGDYVAHTTSNYIDGNASVTEDLLDLDSQVSTNAGNISTNTSNISTNSSNISSAQSEIDAVEGALGAAVSSAGAYVAHTTSNYIDGNASITEDLLDLDAQVNTNASSISTNASNISTNASNISTNSSNISSNDTDISNLQAALGASTEAGINFANNNYITDGVDLVNSLSALDAQVKTNADSISTISTGMSWKEKVLVITADGDLNSASNGTSLSTLLPFSDDEGTAMVIGNFAAGDFILSQNGASSKLFYVYDDAGTLKVEDNTGGNHSGVGMEALALGHTFYVQNDLIDSPDGQENSAAYSYNGSDLVKIADVDWNLASGINLDSGYAAGAGTVAAGDSIFAAIQKLDGNVGANSTSISNVQSEVDAIESAMGSVISTAGAYVAHTTSNYIDGNSSVTEDLLDLDSQVSTNASGISTNASNISSNDTDISNLQGALGSSTEAAINYSSNNYVVDATDLVTAVGALDSQVGTNASNISTNSSDISTNASNIATNASNISSNDTDISNLQGALGASTEGTINYSSNNYVTDGVDLVGAVGSLDTQVKANADAVADIQNHSSAADVTTEAVVADALVDGSDNIMFKIVVKNASGKYSAIVDCLHDGLSTDLGDASNADATVVDYNTFSEMFVGTEPTFTMSVGLSGTGAAQKVELKVSAGAAVQVRAYQIKSA